MFSGFLRLILISAGTLFFTALAIVFVRWMGSQQTFAPPPHPWFAFAEWHLYQPDPSEICLSKTLPSSVAPDVIAWLPVRFKNGTWTLPCENGELKPETLLQNSRHANWIVHVEAHETAHLDALVDALAAFDKEKSFGIHSGSQTVARYMRKKAPQWLFAADAASLLRLHMFASLWLETAFDFWPDFIVQYDSDKNTQFSER